MASGVIPQISVIMGPCAGMNFIFQNIFKKRGHAKTLL
jgi:hypothetical protein